MTDSELIKAIEQAVALSNRIHTYSLFCGKENLDHVKSIVKDRLPVCCVDCITDGKVYAYRI